MDLEQAQRMRRPNGVIMVPWDMFNALVDAAEEVERERDRVRTLEDIMRGLDCRQAGVGLADWSGSHCPVDDSCARCRYESEIDRLRAAYELLDESVGELDEEHTRLRAALTEIEKLPGNTYYGDIARRALGGSE